jgi:ADP-ribosylglycohydrolase
MIGAIIGDVVGSPYEGAGFNFVDDRNFPLFDERNSRFTDDTVLTCATADTLLNPVKKCRMFMNRYLFSEFYKKWATEYPNRGYGSGFSEWVENGGITVNSSYANGCMMRCSPIALYFEDLKDANQAALVSILQTHNSPESRRGVQSIVSTIHMALHGSTKLQIKAYVEENFGHMLDLTVDQLRELPKTTIRCNVTAPQALICFMESTDYESAIRNAVYTRGDTDTIAAIAGSIAEAFYGIRSIPQEMIDGAKQRLAPEMIELINRFYHIIGEYHKSYRDFII